MFVLGIDPGLTRTGYGLVARGRPPRVVAAGVIRTDRDRPDAERLAELFDDLTAVIAQHRPGVVAIERIFTNRNLQTALGVVRASGVALLAAAQAGIPVVEYPPTTIKLAITAVRSSNSSARRSASGRSRSVRITPAATTRGGRPRATSP